MSLKHDLQNLITSNGQKGKRSLIKRTQIFLGGNEIPSSEFEQKQSSRKEEARKLICYIQENNLLFNDIISNTKFIAQGAEQKVYQFDKKNVVKFNDAIFYAYWKDYFNSLLIHNFFFAATAYELLGFKIIDDKIFAVVKQPFIKSTEDIDLKLIKKFLDFNNFQNTRNQDYINKELGIILEDLHDENIISHQNIPYFIDTVFYLTDEFYLG